MDLDLRFIDSGAINMSEVKKNKPEDYGYKPGMNIAPFINKCIDETGECYISEGEHIVGRNDSNWHLGHVWSDSSIVWGWNRKNDIKLIGAGRDKTILKWISNCNYNYLFGKPMDAMVMVATNWNESCDNNTIEGITFDGNYIENNGNATLMAIRIRGENNIVKNCGFKNFAAGSNNRHECFQIIIGPKDANGKGSQIIDNYFTSPGRKSNSPASHVPENTAIAVGGIDSLVDGNIFEDFGFSIVNQQSPLHGISLAGTKNAKIINNKFINFQGCCVYMDSWTNEDFIIQNNEAQNIWQFLQLTCQHWDNQDQISFNKNAVIANNKIELAEGNCYWHWNKDPVVSNFCGYVHAPNVDHVKYPGFENILISQNDVKLGYRNINEHLEESTKLHCYLGSPVDENKIKMVNNLFSSSMPQPKPWWRKLLDWFKKFFKI